MKHTQIQKPKGKYKGAKKSNQKKKKKLQKKKKKKKKKQSLNQLVGKYKPSR